MPTKGVKTGDSLRDNAIFLRVFAEVGDQAAANTISRRIEDVFTRYGAIVRCDTPKQYWKIPEYFEVFVVLRPFKPVPDAFDSILTALGSGWEVHRFAGGGNWAIWNAGIDDATFAITEVRWANLECLHEPESALVNPE